MKKSAIVEIMNEFNCYLNMANLLFEEEPEALIGVLEIKSSVAPPSPGMFFSTYLNHILNLFFINKYILYSIYQKIYIGNRVRIYTKEKVGTNLDPMLICIEYFKGKGDGTYNNQRSFKKTCEEMGLPFIYFRRVYASFSANRKEFRRKMGYMEVEPPSPQVAPPGG